MPNPLQGADIVGHTLRASELGVASTGIVLATASPKDLTAYKTAVPETVLVLVRLSSGTVNVQVDTTADGVFSSAEVSTGNFNDTVFRALTVDTSAANPYVNVRLVTSANAIVDRVLVLPLARLTTGEDWYNVRDGVMAVASTANADGSGVFTFTAAD